MNIVLQPEKSRVCGQACVAMILGISLDQSIDLIGHNKGTKTKDLIRILELHGYTCSKKLIPLKGKNLPEYCICKVAQKKKPKRNWHWIVHTKNGVFFDPEPEVGIIRGMTEFHNIYPKCEITSFLLIKKQ